MLGIAVLAFLGVITEGAMADWSAVYLASLHASAALAAAGYAAFSLAMAAVRAVNDRQLVRTGALLAAFGFCMAVWTPHFATVILGFALVGPGLANILPILFSTMGRTWRQAPSVGVAMAVTAGFAGFLTGPPVIGLTAQLVGLRLALGLLLAATLAVAGPARAIGHVQRRAKPRTARTGSPPERGQDGAAPGTPPDSVHALRRSWQTRYCLPASVIMVPVVAEGTHGEEGARRHSRRFAAQPPRAARVMPPTQQPNAVLRCPVDRVCRAAGHCRDDVTDRRAFPAVRGSGKGAPACAREHPPRHARLAMAGKS